jgi:multidrug efflux pump subunit AcrB
LYAAIEDTLKNLDLPAGHRMVLAGEIADQSEANGKLFGILPLALARIIVLLVGQFNSFRKGGIILATIPLILIGGALFYGMASVIAFGLVLATVLTLGFVPVMYTLLFRIPTRDAVAATLYNG